MVPDAIGGTYCDCEQEGDFRYSRRRLRRDSEGRLWGGSALDTVLRPGDTVVVPEKAIGGGIQWTNLFQIASIASSIASTVFIAVHY